MSEQLNISLRDQLIDLGINEILIDELVSVASRVNYGQVISLPYLIAVVVYIKFFSVGTVYVQVVLIFCFQMPNYIHAFVGSVGLAGMHGNLWSVEGGNYRVAEELARISQAKMVASRVSNY